MDDARYIRPKVSGIIGALPVSGVGKGLTGISSKDAVYLSTKWTWVERFNIRPDRCWTQNTRFHAFKKVFDDNGFDFHISGNTDFSDSSFNSSFKSEEARAEGQYSG